MVKQCMSHNSIVLKGKATEIKKSLHALLLRNSEQATLAQVVASCAKPDRR